MDILPAVVDFPTPPLPDATAITFLTPAMGAFLGRPRCARGIVGGALWFGNPCFGDQHFAALDAAFSYWIHTKGFSWATRQVVENRRRKSMRVGRNRTFLRMFLPSKFTEQKNSGEICSFQCSGDHLFHCWNRKPCVKKEMFNLKFSSSILNRIFLGWSSTLDFYHSLLSF